MIRNDLINLFLDLDLLKFILILINTQHFMNIKDNIVIELLIDHSSLDCRIWHSFCSFFYRRVY